MEKTMSTEQMKNNMKAYIDSNGIGSLFQVVAEIMQEKVDAKDLEEHRAAVEIERKATVIPRAYLEEHSTPVSITEEIKKKGSIYTPEHRSAAMVENGIIPNTGKEPFNESSEQTVTMSVDEEKPEAHKARVLEMPKNNSSKIIYEDIQTVSPGQLKL